MFIIKLSTAIAIVALRSSNSLLASAQTVCGITDDASVSDCQHIIDNFPQPNFDNKCHYFVGGISHDAFNVACFGGCCIYTDQNDISADLIKQGAQATLGCQGPLGTVNGRTKLQSGSDAPSICLSNGNGCGGCFHNE